MARHVLRAPPVDALCTILTSVIMSSLMSLLSVVTGKKVFILSCRLIAARASRSWHKLLNCIPELNKTWQNVFFCINKLLIQFSLINLLLGNT